MPSQADWIASLSPWPAEFGLDRMRALLDELGNPQRAYPAIHVVGTNGKSTATRTIEALLDAEGLRVGAYLSPHVRGWSERIRVGGDEADFERAVARVREPAERLGATQFETLTAAALAEFAHAGVDVAVVEAGLGGRLDATNVLDAPVVLLTSVGLEHTDVLGYTTDAIAREKLAVAHAATVVVLSDNTHAHLVPHARVVFGGAREAASAFLGRPAAADVDVHLPGRLDVRGEHPFELWDGAHNLDGARHLVERLRERDFVLVVSILTDKDADGMLATLAEVASRAVVTSSSSERAHDPDRLAELAALYFASVEAVPDSHTALARARELAGEHGAVLVTGSLYLLADLYQERDQPVRWRSLVSG